MSDEPVAWGERPLGELVREDRPICYGVLKPGEFHPDGVPLVRILDLKANRVSTRGLFRVGRSLDAEFARSRLEGGEVLLSIQGTVGRVAIAPASLAGANISRTIARIHVDDDASPAFLRHWMLSERGQAAFDATIVGTTRSSLNIGALRTIGIPLPPLPEQRRIAEILDTLDEAIRKTEEVIAKLEQMKQGLLHDLLTRGIDENGELRDPERHPEQFKDSPLGRIPREWAVKVLADVAEVRSGIAKNSNRAVSDPVWVHFLRVANVQDGYLDLEEMSKIRIGRAEIERYAVQPGDVLMNEGGDLDKLGRGAVWRGEYEPCVHQNHVFVVRCCGGIYPDFLDAWTGAAAARRYFMNTGKQTTNLASINKTSLGKLPIAVPPVPEQTRIIAGLAEAASQIALESLELKKLRTLKRGLMDDLLTGRVRVAEAE